MKSKNILCGLSVAVALRFGVFAGSAQTNKYLFSGSETNITLNPGTYIITAYGAQGGAYENAGGGHGAKMSAEFNFSTPTKLTLLVGAGGGGGYYNGSYNGFAVGGGGGGGSFAVESNTPLVIAGGGGGGGGLGPIGGSGGGNGNVSTNGGNGNVSTNGGTGGGGYNGGGNVGTNGGTGGGGGGGGGYNGGGGGGGGSIIDSSAIKILAEVSGIASPDDPTNGEIIIITVSLALAINANAAFGFTNGAFGFNVSGPPGASVVIQASTDLQTWIPLQTNQLGSGPLHFSDPQSSANVHRFYRTQFSP